MDENDITDPLWLAPASPLEKQAGILAPKRSGRCANAQGRNHLGPRETRQTNAKEIKGPGFV